MRLARTVLVAALAVPCTSHASGGNTAPSAAPSAEATAALPKPPPDAELPTLTPLAPIKRPELDQDALKEVEKLLRRLTSEKADIRDAAVAELEKADEAQVSAIHTRIQAVRESLDRDKAPRIIADARKAARELRKKEKKKDKDADENEDWLSILLASPAPKSDAWRDVVELLAMVRMLRTIGTTPAVREIIELRANFGDMLRIDLMRQVVALGDKAVPALLEARKHDASVVREFADKALDTLGKVTPGEAVSTSDPEALADTLRAFGHVREVDAVDVLLSFANHDRKKVREAARHAIVSIGEPGRFRLRDAYQDLTGEKVDKSVPWDVLAKRIFWFYDHARAAEVIRAFDAGVAASKKGDHALAVAEFDKVLAVDPQFDKRADMAASYVALGKATSFDEAETRLALLRKARRLRTDDARTIDAEIAFTEAKILLTDGRPDRFLLARAVELDPDHEEAKTLLGAFEREAVKTADAVQPKRPYALVGGIAAASVLLAGLIAVVPRRKKKQGAPPKPKDAAGAAPEDGASKAGAAGDAEPSAAAPDSAARPSFPDAPLGHAAGDPKPADPPKS